MALEIVEERIHLESVFRSYNRVKKAPTSFVNIDQLKTEMSKIVPILNFPTPAKRKQFRIFLGRVNWQAWFIKNIAEIKATSLKRMFLGLGRGEAAESLRYATLSVQQAPELGPPDSKFIFYFRLRYLIETPQPIKTLGFYRTIRILFEIVTENLSL